MGEGEISLNSGVARTARGMEKSQNFIFAHEHYRQLNRLERFRITISGFHIDKSLNSLNKITSPKIRF